MIIGIEKGFIKNITRVALMFFWLGIIILVPNNELEKEYVYPVVQDSERIEQIVMTLPQIQFHYAGRFHDSYANPIEFAQFTMRKSAHMVLYGFLGLSFVWVLKGFGVNGLRSWIIAGLLVLAVAVADETHQYFTDGRTGCIEDVIIDVVGYIILAFIVLSLRKFKT
ncbi:VanZ family protein [Candidatus Syntrophocurvum alkaliphilum]|nr:VanZ family protein [Candidatus Syntrophocurvum alkaliphilum]